MHKILIIDDVEADADSQILGLIHAGIACEARRVDTLEDMVRQLEIHAPDIVLCRASLSKVGGQAALARTREHRPEIPFILVFGTVGEEIAARTVRIASGDPVYLASRTELVSVFARAVKEADERKRRALQGLTLTRLTRMYSERVREIDQLRRQHVNFRKLSRFLKASLSTAEVFTALESLGPELFRNTIGRLYVLPSPGMNLEAVASWGKDSSSEPTLTVHDCWALRQTQAHWVRDPRSELVCPHVTPDSHSTLPYFCVPLFAEGALLGLFHLRYMTDDSKAPEDAGSMESGLNLAIAVAEETSLALANLKARDTLHEQSIRDPLTGLYNRRFLEEFLLREIARAGRKKHSLSIIALDIDHFKRINDTSGHGAGDVVLRRISLLLQGFVRTSDIACRVGGEEFSLLLPEATLQIATQRAEDIRHAVHEMRVRYEERTLGAITISLGVASFPDHGTTPEALIRAADKALYAAKERGRDRVAAAAA